MRTRWRGMQVFVVSMLVIVALACGRYMVDAGPGAVTHVLDGMGVSLPEPQ